MSISETIKAQKYAAIAEVSAAECAIYANVLKGAPNYAAEAAASASAAEQSASSSAASSSNAQEYASSASSSALSAFESAQTAGNAAAAAVGQCIRVPTGELTSPLPVAADRKQSALVFDADGNSSIKPLSGFALLDSDGKIPASQIPSIAISHIFVVSRESEMLALDAYTGDVAKRTDLGFSLMLSQTPASTLGNWVRLNDDVLAELAQPTGSDLIGSPYGTLTDVAEDVQSKVNQIDLSGAKGLALVGVCPDVSTLRTLSVPAGKKVMLLGYYSSKPGVGGGLLYASSDTSLSDDGVRVFVTNDGTRLIRETNGDLYASWAGAIGDWNGTTGTDNKAAIERLIAAAGTSYRWVIDLNNVGVSSVVINGRNGWKGHIEGSVFNISAKPSSSAVDRRSQDGGVFPTFKITNSDNWKLTGGYIDNRYREAFYIETCNGFVWSCDVKGSGINDNLNGNYLRYCSNFKIENATIYKSGAIPITGYYSWVQALLLWDCHFFGITNIISNENAGNGIYIGSNVTDYYIDGFQTNKNAMSGIQLAWSSFGTFPQRGSISNGVISGNRADGIDINNTMASGIVRIDLSVNNITHSNNGYNTDGTVTADGSGLGTFINVSHWGVTGCSATSPARAGLFISSCENFRVDNSFVNKQQTSNSENHGFYIENSNNFDVDIDVIVDSSNTGMYSIRTYGVIENGTFRGRYTGRAVIGTDSTYINCNAENAVFISPTTVNVLFPFRKCNIVCSGTNAADIYSSVNGCRFVSNAGHGGVVYGSGISIDNSEITGTDAGLWVNDGFNRISARGNKISGGTSSGLRINTGSKHIIENNSLSSTGGNSVIISNATAVTYIGNDDSTSPTNFSGTAFTLNN